MITYIVSYTPLGQPRESIQSGNYGSPPNAWWWLKQSVIYFCGLFGMKICVLAIFILMPWISIAGDWALGWTEGNEKLQIAFVMMIFPLIMNILQYYIIDSFIKKPIYEDDAADDTDDQRGRFNQLLSSPEDEFDSDDEEEHGVTKVRESGHKGVNSESNLEYDPDLDGDAPTVIGSSSNRHGLTGGKLA